VGTHGPDNYLKTKEHLGMYASTDFKNGFDVTIYVLAKAKTLVKPEVPTLKDQHTAHEKRFWEYRMSKLMKTEGVVVGNLCSLFMVLMSISDADTKNQVESRDKFPDLEKKWLQSGN